MTVHVNVAGICVMCMAGMSVFGRYAVTTPVFGAMPTCQSAHAWKCMFATSHIVHVMGDIVLVCRFGPQELA